MMQVCFKNFTPYIKKQEISKGSVSTSVASSERPYYGNLSNVAPYYTKINFRGRKPLALSEIPVLNHANIGELVGKVKGLKRKPLILSDYDGTHTDFAHTRMSATPTARPHIGEEGFMKLCSTMESSGIPFVILTTRSFEKLGDPTLIGKKATEALNVVGINGNQMRLNLPQNERTQDFIDKWAAKSDYTTSVKELPNNKVHVEIDPVVPQELHKIGERFNNDLKPFGFELNNESIITYFKWNKLFQASKDATVENPHVIDLQDRLFTDLSSWLEKHPSTSESKTILAKTPDGKTCSLSYDELADYGLNKFKQICAEEYGTKLSSKKLGDLTDAEKTGVKALVSDQKEKRFYEIADIRAKINNKGTSLDFLSKLFADEKESFPIFLGDSVSAHNDDEFGMKKASELKGAGIAILRGNSRDDIAERNRLTTQADFKLESFADTAPFLFRFAELFIK